MPKLGYKSITVPAALYERLEGLANETRGDWQGPKWGLADAIKTLLVEHDNAAVSHRKRKPSPGVKQCPADGAV